MEQHDNYEKGGEWGMKQLISLLLVFFGLNMFIVSIASADPRMEINKDFCHFILDTVNTDNEVFVADCGAMITTTEKIVQTGTVQITCEENNKIASGYSVLNKVMQQTASPVPPGTTIFFTSDTSTTPCTMVESNGTAYTSMKWQSSIKAGNVKKGMVTVQYELFCQEGE